MFGKRKTVTESITTTPLSRVVEAMRHRYPELGDTVNLFRCSHHVFFGCKWHFGSSNTDDDYTKTKTYLAFTENEVVRAIGDVVAIGSWDQIWTFEDDDVDDDDDGWDGCVVRIRHYKK